LNPDTVTHPSTNRARRRVTSLIRSTSLPTAPSRHHWWKSYKNRPRNARVKVKNVRFFLWNTVYCTIIGKLMRKHLTVSLRSKTRAYCNKTAEARITRWRGLTERYGSVPHGFARRQTSHITLTAFSTICVCVCELSSTSESEVFVLRHCYCKYKPRAQCLRTVI